MHANDCADLLALRRDAGVAQLAGASTLAHPLGGGFGLPVGIGDLDVAAKADDVVKAEFAEEREQLLIAEAAIGQDGDPAAGRDEVGQTVQAGIFEGVALLRELVLKGIAAAAAALVAVPTEVR